MNQLTIGKFIALKRKEKNLTQEQLAETLGVSNKTVSKWECGKCMPDYGIVKPLCQELGITVSELWTVRSRLTAVFGCLTKNKYLICSGGYSSWKSRRCQSSVSC